jgi:hypothetical protein
MTRATPTIPHPLRASRYCAWPAGLAAPFLHQSPNPAARRPAGATLSIHLQAPEPPLSRFLEHDLPHHGAAQ